MTHPIGSVRFMTGLLAVATGTLLFGAGVWSGRTLEHASFTPPPPAAAPVCDCNADEVDDDDDADEVDDVDDLADAVDTSNLYDRALDAYVHGQYQRALTLSRSVHDVRAWRIGGAASCYLRDLEAAREAYGHLDLQGRTLLSYVCARNGLHLR